MNKTIQVKDFCRLLRTTEAKFPDECKKLISDYDFTYTELSKEERDSTILHVIRSLNRELEVSGQHRQQRWEDGWSENLNEFIRANYDLKMLVPKFVKLNEVIRYNGNYVQPISPEFETQFVSVLRTYIIHHLFASVDNVYEYGCGTAHNLVEFWSHYPQKTYYGLDWAVASQKIIDLLREKLGMNIFGNRFDLFAPDKDYQIKDNSGLLTVGALEQMGNSFTEFLDYVLIQKPSICVHMETTYELYDQDDLFDYLSAKYLEKRGYLNGFLDRLKELYSKGMIELLGTHRTFGSLFHDGYTLIIWKPL